MTQTYPAQDLSSITIAHVAVSFPPSIEIFNRYKLDYCCNGKKPFATACETAGLDAASVWEEIHRATFTSSSDETIKFDTWGTPLLVDFIIQHHHRYARVTIPQLLEQLNKVCYAHRDESPYLIEVKKNFHTLSVDLLNHLTEEEEVVFPAILTAAAQRDDTSTFPDSGPVIAQLQNDHKTAGDLIKSLRALTTDYTPPDSACATLRVTYIMLREFDKDLMRHIHLENNILFPRVLRQEPT